MPFTSALVRQGMWCISPTISDSFFSLLFRRCASISPPLSALTVRHGILHSMPVETSPEGVCADLP
ncbi:MAG TPA: hypothetical protein K8V47_04760 [Candidatus Amulumruptor caecigallinarius]|uniref:Uncharacterized protein n=1 Tax=Candidatus Amulumruptor caecigallinarius TaxID=2109911 RepID=A0A921E8E1_9BACT|nr:hypothetical protein [Candidatus Amulumruptor caecigallinarius]